MLFFESIATEGIVVLSLFVSCLLTLFLYAVYSGLLHNIQIGTREPDEIIGEEGLVVAYKIKKGPVKECGAIFTEATSLLPNRKTIGLFYDDPESVPASETRYAVGSILSLSGDEDIRDDEMKKMILNGFKIAHFPKPAFAVMTSFPFSTTLSIYLAVYRVYPRLKRYISSQNLCAYPAIEIYSDDIIKFIFPLSRQDEFFVAEFSEEDVSIATTEVSSFAENSAQYQRDIRDQSAGTINDNEIFIRPKTPETNSTLNKTEDSSVDAIKSDSASSKELGERDNLQNAIDVSENVEDKSSDDNELKDGGNNNVLQ